MKVLTIGAPAFQDWAAKLNSGHAWDMVTACDPEEVEDHIATSRFQAILIDLDDTRALALKTFSLLSRLQKPFAAIGFSKDEHNERHHVYFERGMNVCFGLDTTPSIAKLRCNAVIRLSQGIQSHSINMSDVSLDVECQRVSVKGQTVSLPRREYQLLELLFLTAPRTVTIEHFYDHVYGYNDPPSSKMFDVLICKLRKKLKLAGSPADIIETRWGLGYAVSEHAPTYIAEAA